MKGRALTLHLLAALLALFATAFSTMAADDREEFFIVSSMDAAHGRIVLKRPTEVTLLMQVTAETAYRDEQGKPLKLADLRTGDTGYITYRQDTSGATTALLVRLGPMTVQELQRRYLKPGLR
ncbi:MAG TPA: hypothetical protein VH988_34830 [Thermoanaerobaculia bacterium]|jgi:hypothetical protein|nr:hypothetical protein [Thermoanaerobaculia bacterium]